MTSFTDQSPRTATETDCAAPWDGERDGKRFRCYLCGHRFAAGDTWRWVHATHRSVINFLVCGDCDGPDVLDQWVTRHDDGMRRFWWMQ